MNKEPYKVSILVPVYNVEKYIERCARSIFQQTYNNLEIIFVDDKTPDNSIEILNAVIQEYPNRIKQTQIIHHINNMGLAGTRNTAVSAATGTFVTHLDSDDWLELSAIELLVQRQIETGAEVVSGGIVTYKGAESIYWDEPDFKTYGEFLKSVEKKMGGFPLCSRLIKRNLYVDNNIRTKDGLNYGEDLQIVTRLFVLASSVARQPRVVYHYDITNESSYMHMTGIKKLKGQSQMILSILSIRPIIKTYDQDALDQFDSDFSYNIYANMVDAAKFGEEELFDQFVDSLNQLNKKSICSVLGNNAMLVFLKKRYWFMKYIFLNLAKVKS